MKGDKKSYCSDDMLEKFFAGELTPREEEYVREVLADSRNDDDMVRSLGHAFEKMVQPTDKPGDEAYRMLGEFQSRAGSVKRTSVPVKRQRKIWGATLAVAAVFLPLLVAGWWILYHENPSPEETQPCMATVIETGSKGMDVVLPCGSVVYLNRNTKVTYHEETYMKKREIDLQGEAYLRVTKVEGVPFAVNTGTLRVNVTGTTFNVEASGADAETVVSLYEGGVLVEAEGTIKILREHQEFAWNSESKSAVTKEISSFMPAWMVNDHTISLKEIFSEIENRYGKQVVLGPSVDTLQQYYFLFDHKAGIDQTLSVICEISGNVEYEIKDETVYIKSLL